MRDVVARLAADPFAPRAHAIAAEVALRAGDADSARAHAERLVELSPLGLDAPEKELVRRARAGR